MFAVFNPAVVVPLVSHGWTLTDVPTICGARTDGAVAQLERIPRPEPDGAVRAGDLLRRAVEPPDPRGGRCTRGCCPWAFPAHRSWDVWRLTDLLREYRGDAHTAAWTSAGSWTPLRSDC